MSDDHIDRKRLRVTGRHRAQRDSHVEVRENREGATIVVSQAFGPRGDNLIGLSDVRFDDWPAVTLLVEAGGRQGLLHLSPIHGDSRKEGLVDIEPGTRCRLLCPVTQQPLDRVPDVSGDLETAYYAIYLTPQLSMGSIVAMSDIWGHPHSRIIDNFELISLWDR
ncbi:MAG TPA: hypothetical protein VKB80_19510 [Kofleriaceae bacterium]|nr:hypothetical protein [Kofleriaceae bacterium]